MTSISRLTLGRTVSVAAVAICLLTPAVAAAQDGAQATTQEGAQATNAQPTPNEPAPDPNRTNAETTGQQTASPGPTVPDTATNPDDIVVTGIRASLERSIAIKRDSTGVVDAISAEDIGKFPDTNLAESLQRITGVSINRRDGEGAEVTVRGFGPQYNLVTLNGRQLAASDQTAVGGPVDFSRNTSRSFDFSNLASEGVKTLEVYKTGRAAIPTGGIGATINVVTRRPLDSRESGLSGSIGAKADYDTSSDYCFDCGSHVTPQVSGLLSWSNPDQTLGASLFGSYQKRNFSRSDVTVNGWNVTSVADFLNPANNHVKSGATINNQPADLTALVARPDDARYQFAEDSNERINAQGALQWRPVETLTLTADGLFAQNIAHERAGDESNWFNQNFDEVTFDSGHSVYTPVYIHETIPGAQKDAGFEQQERGQKNRLFDFGLNAKWDLTDNFQVNADGHIGKSKSTPDNPNGMSSTLSGISVPTLGAHSWDYSNGFPTQTVSFVDPVGATLCTSTATPAGCTKGNANGELDVQDLGSQIGREISTQLSQNIKEGRLDFGWKLGGNSRFDFGADYRTTNTHATQTTYQQTLGDWGNSFPRDIDAIAPGLMNTVCVVCKFHHYDTDATGDARIAFRTEHPTDLFNALSSYYAGLPVDANGNAVVDGKNHQLALNGFADDRVKESIWAAYGQVTWKGQLGSHDATLVAGARYERTTVNSVSLQSVPTALVWQSDNDWIAQLSPDYEPVTGKGHYDNLLPSMDFQLNVTQNLIGRLSFSKTIARPSYGDLFASTSAGNPNDATYDGGTATGTAHNPNLLPLASDNFDLSLEWYFKPASYVSAGFFEKRVHNFIGNTIVNRNLFNLRNPSSGAAGSRSGTAVQQLTANGVDTGDVNLFTYTALLQQNGGNAAAATAEFLSHYDRNARALDIAYSNQIASSVDIIADDNDPLFDFAVSQPINNQDAKIHGFEVAGQYFFGQTGIGVAAAYTYVRGNIGVDVAADPNVNVFALIGLSDTANATLIYDKHGISARLSYNWRDKFLDNINIGASHNPEFTKAYGQLDFNVSYDVTPRLALSIEGINLTEESVYQYIRSPNQVSFAAEGNARYLLGARYRF